MYMYTYPLSLEMTHQWSGHLFPLPNAMFMNFKLYLPKSVLTRMASLYILEHNEIHLSCGLLS